MVLKRVTEVFHQMVFDDSAFKFKKIHSLARWFVHDILTIPILINIALIIGVIGLMGNPDVALALLVVAAIVFIFSALGSR
jgi:hypothetical protein